MTFIQALVAFGLITLLLVGFEIFYTYATQGFLFGFSSNRPTGTLSPFGLRIKRTLQNHIESAAYCVPILVASALTNLTGSGVEIAALLIVIGRAAFALLYYSGISFIRVPAFVLSTFSSLYLGILLLVNIF